MAKNNWAYEEHIVAFNLYCKTPFTKINANYAPVKKLAKIIGRSDSSVAMKLANFARLDPALQARNISGLSRGAKGEEEVWKEFNGNWDKLAFESERILAEYKNRPVEDSANISLDDLPPEGKDREAVIRARVNQSFFRKAVLSSYNNKCCITRLAVPELLIASHIVPWSLDINNRTNPANGLCLNALFDKAFDKGLLTITPDFNIIFADFLIEKVAKQSDFDIIQPFHGRKISLPQRFFPNKDFLAYHNEYIFLDHLR